MKTWPIKISCVVIVIIALTACSGWQLRGNDNLDKSNLSAYIDAGRISSLSSAIIVAFRDRGINIVSNSEDAELLVTILSSDFRRRVVSLDPRTGKVRELEIQLFSEVIVRSKESGLLIPRQVIRLQRDYFFDELAAEFTTTRGQVIESDLAKDWAFAVVYRALTSLKNVKLK